MNVIQYVNHLAFQSYERTWWMLFNTWTTWLSNLMSVPDKSYSIREPLGFPILW